jgi:hypothetical protein
VVEGVLAMVGNSMVHVRPIRLGISGNTMGVECDYVESDVDGAVQGWVDVRLS